MTATRESRGTKLILFDVGRQRYSLLLDCMQEVLPLPALIKLPTDPDLVEGFLNLDGEVIPVVRLDRLFGLPREENHLYTPLLIMHSSDTTLALLVSSVVGISQVDEEKIVPIPRGDTVNDCAIGTVSMSHGTVIVLNADRLLLKQEMARINMLKERAAQRIAQLAEVESA